MRLEPASSSVLSAYIPTMTVTTYILNANYDHHPNLMLTNTNYGVITAESHGNVFWTHGLRKGITIHSQKNSISC